MACKCSNKNTSTMIFSCSGASDTGEIADRASRQLAKHGLGKMNCLAKFSAQISGIVDNVKAVDDLVVIDGCPVHCAKKTVENAGCTDYKHLCLADIGLAKGSSEPSDKNIALAFEEAKKLVKSCCGKEEIC